MKAFLSPRDWDVYCFIAVVIGLNIGCGVSWIFDKATKPWRDRVKERKMRELRQRLESRND
mgnify:CR=1 FL=1